MSGNDIREVYNDDMKNRHAMARSSKHAKNGASTSKRIPKRNNIKQEEAPVKKYNLGSPVSWSEFRTWPTSIRKEYLEHVFRVFRPTCYELSQMLGTPEPAVSHEFKIHGLKFDGSRKGIYAPEWQAWLDRKMTLGEIEAARNSAKTEAASEESNTSEAEPPQESMIHLEPVPKNIFDTWSNAEQKLYLSMVTNTFRAGPLLVGELFGITREQAKALIYRHEAAASANTRGWRTPEEQDAWNKFIEVGVDIKCQDVLAHTLDVACKNARNAMQTMQNELPARKSVLKKSKMDDRAEKAHQNVTPEPVDTASVEEPIHESVSTRAEEIAAETCVSARELVRPVSGSMVFDGNVKNIANMIQLLLGEESTYHIEIHWETK